MHEAMVASEETVVRILEPVDKFDENLTGQGNLKSVFACFLSEHFIAPNEYLLKAHLANLSDVRIH